MLFYGFLLAAGSSVSVEGVRCDSDEWLIPGMARRVGSALLCGSCGGMFGLQGPGIVFGLFVGLY